MHDSLFAMLTDIGWEVDYRPQITRQEIKSIHRNYDGLIIRSKTFVDHDLLGDSPTLKFIGRAGAGVDNLDQTYLDENKVTVIHAADGNKDAVGEYTIGALLSLMRNIPKGNTEVRNGLWDREGNRGMELMGKTIGIVGYGNMGYSFAKRLAGFSCKVLAFDKYKIDFTDGHCEQVEMKRLFQETDILSFHVPLTAETRMMVNLDYFNKFEKKILVINTARGEILSLTDLVAAMRINKVSGAVLDVLENEKLDKLSLDQTQAMQYLRQQPNVILTPHIAGWTFESHIKINVALVQKIKKLASD
jgi:D-3-phosphoglycerate dehydrogenase / 2-oxoglutarate reductase